MGAFAEQALDIEAEGGDDSRNAGKARPRFACGDDEGRMRWRGGDWCRFRFRRGARGVACARRRAAQNPRQLDRLAVRLGPAPAGEARSHAASRQSYVYEPVRYAGTPAVITAMANSEVELGNLAFCRSKSRSDAGLDDLRIVADQFRDGAGDGYSNQFFVLKDSPIQKVADLKGKIVATNVAGSAVDIAMRAMLRKHGLEDKRDYTVVEAPFPP